MEALRCERSSRTGGQVVPFGSEPRLAVQFFLSQFVQQNLILVFVMRQGCPLLAELCNAAKAVAVLAWRTKRNDEIW